MNSTAVPPAAETATPSPAPAIQRSILPQGLHRYTLIAVLLVGFAALIPLISPTDLDFWWHLKTGQIIAQSGVPHFNDYSYTELGHPWIVYEWLIELVMNGLFQLGGYVALVVFFGILQGIAAALVYLLLRQRGANRVVAIALLLTFFTFAAPTWGVRPQIVASLFIAAFYLVLLNYKRDPSHPRKLALLPLLMLVWANMHGTYVAGFALLGIFVIGEALNNWVYRATQPTPIRPLLLTFAATVAITLLNPYFLDLWLLPLGYTPTSGGGNTLFYVAEWQSPDFHDPTNLLLAVSFILLMLVGVSRYVSAKQRANWRIKLRRYLDFTDCALVGGFAILALQGFYTLPIYGVVVLPILGAGLARTWPLLGRSGDQPVSAGEGRVNLILAPILLAGLTILLVAAPTSQVYSRPRLDAGLSYPVAAADYVSSLPPNSVRMFNTFGYGGYLIYRLYPTERVFIDGRVDVYRDGVHQDYEYIHNLLPDWREHLAKYDINLIVSEADTPFGAAIAHEPNWQLVNRDGKFVVYRKQ